MRRVRDFSQPRPLTLREWLIYGFWFVLCTLTAIWLLASTALWLLGVI